MTTSKYIPAGRTSEVQRRGLSLQVQTEYAERPAPRITTTILNAGQVLHKIERNLDKSIESLEEQARAEWSIKRQHAEILEIIEDSSRNLGVEIGGLTGISSRSLTIYDHLHSISGVQRVYRLDNEGNLIGGKNSESFRQAFGAVFKNLRELVDVFLRLPGVDIKREKGVFEVERDRLYVA